MSAGRAPSAFSSGNSAPTPKFGTATKWSSFPDHYIFTADSMSNRNVDILRDFVREQDLPYFYDVIDDPNGLVEVRPDQGLAATASTAPITRASATPRCRKRATPARAKSFSAPTPIPAWRALSTNSPPASATPTRVLSWARASCLLKVPGDHAFPPRRPTAAGRHGQGHHPALHRRRSALTAPPTAPCSLTATGVQQPHHGRPHDDRQHGHRSRRQERHFRV